MLAWQGIDKNIAHQARGLGELFARLAIRAGSMRRRGTPLTRRCDLVTDGGHAPEFKGAVHSAALRSKPSDEELAMIGKGANELNCCRSKCRLTVG